MFRLEKDFRFEASHQLPNHDGKCARLHGHSFKGTVILQSNETIKNGSKTGMIQDFGDVSKVVGILVDTFLDHWHLNDTTKLLNPTSEELARWIFYKLRPLLPLLVAIRIEETCTSRAEYWYTSESSHLINTSTE